jgi:hypothetical protein
MKTISKLLGAGAAVAALGLVAAHAFADQGHGYGRMGQGMGQGMGEGMGHGKGMGHGRRGGGHGMGMGQQDPAERLGAARSEIGIKPEQAAAWDVYAKVVVDTAAERRKVRDGIDRDAVHNMKPEDRQTFRESMMKQRDDSFAKIKSAAETLVAQLDEAQQAKARQTLPGLAEGGPGSGMRQGMMGGPGMGHGMGHGRGHSGGEGMGPRWQR